MIGDGAGLDELADLRGEVLADAGNREPLRRRQVGDPLRSVGDRLRCVAVGADLERVLALDFEQVADLGEDTGDGQIVETHGLDLGRRAALDAESLGLDREVEQLPAVRGDGLADRGNVGRFAETHEAAAASGAADLASVRAGILVPRRGWRRSPVS